MRPREQIADEITQALEPIWKGLPFLSEERGLIDQLAALRADREPRPTNPITLRIALELLSHEAIVQEAYRDSEGVWTWGVGVTNASGHLVHPRYKDNPQPVRRCLEVYVWLLREKYLPPVLKRFADRALTEAQLAAALSFHYNTGAITHADWVDDWLAGRIEEARASFMNWRKPASIIERRQKERDLFFDGVWCGDGTAMLWPVRKPSYTPDWRHGMRIDVRKDLEGLLA